MCPFFNPTILRGWCMLGVFLLLAFKRLGHECHDLFESLRWNACVHRPDLGLYSHPKELRPQRNTMCVSLTEVLTQLHVLPHLEVAEEPN